MNSLGLLMLAVKPLRKSSRMTDISEQIQSMASEEAYYWFSKMTDHQVGRRSQKALFDTEPDVSDDGEEAVGDGEDAVDE